MGAFDHELNFRTYIPEEFLNFKRILEANWKNSAQEDLRWTVQNMKKCIICIISLCFAIFISSRSPTFFHCRACWNINHPIFECSGLHIAFWAMNLTFMKKLAKIHCVRFQECVTTTNYSSYKFVGPPKSTPWGSKLFRGCKLLRKLFWTFWPKNLASWQHWPRITFKIAVFGGFVVNARFSSVVQLN